MKKLLILLFLFITFFVSNISADELEPGKWKFFVEDDLSGIVGADNITVKIDDTPLLFEYNSYKKQVLYNFEEWLTSGTHILDIEIKDNVGNMTRRKGEFIIQ